ncbi:NFACT RNA binding domain-containing protein [Enterococcus eurekensis]|uniref:Rqc2 homolog RqcH n=1 Tax=Enterococcus eurekensis TaxID=1159753 RepID=A0ABV9M2B9_9ENTE
MSFDGIFTHLMIQELNQQLKGGRISKVHQPYSNELVLVIRSQGKNHKLLLSAHPSYARIQLTNMSYQNPDTPPNFVMILRKHLDGAILEEIKQVENDRIIHFTFTHRNELGDLENLVLIVELMGRHSTILLLNQATNKILDTIKHIGSSQNTYRALLPGATYVAPPEAKGLNPFHLSDVQAFSQLSSLQEINPKTIQQLFQGFGRDTATELATRLQANPNEKLRVWQQFMAQLKTLEPTLIQTKQKEYFTPFLFESLITQEDTTVTTFTNLSSLLDGFYHDKAERDRVKQQGSLLIKKITNEIKRNEGKLEKREATLLAAENAEDLRQRGELLTTFLHQIPRGVASVELENYYEENAPITIVLDPALSPNQNAQKYFQKYQKLRNAVKLVGEQIEETKQEIAYLQSVLTQLELAGPMDLELIKEELIEEGYVKSSFVKQKRQTKKSQPAKFIASDGTEILVGRNNLQNDQLTLKTAKKTEYWLHAKDIPGSHVIIRSTDPSEQTILEAAELAAFYSKYRHSAQVPVDLVQVKHIRKPNGAKPGYVIYENQKTYYMTPVEENIEKLRQ